MSRFKFYLSIVLSSLCFLLVGAKAVAATSVYVSIASPPVREVVMPPEGYANCYTVSPGFYNGVWMGKHRICQYANSESEGVWVGGYWQCVSLSYGGNCQQWAWVRHHWANYEEVGYMQPWYGSSVVSDHPYYHHYYDNTYYYNGYRAPNHSGYYYHRRYW